MKRAALTANKQRVRIVGIAGDAIRADTGRQRRFRPEGEGRRAVIGEIDFFNPFGTGETRIEQLAGDRVSICDLTQGCDEQACENRRRRD